MVTDRPTEEEMDATLAESFPASDPPSWTRGIDGPTGAPANPAPPDEEKSCDTPLPTVGRSTKRPLVPRRPPVRYWRMHCDKPIGAQLSIRPFALYSSSLR